ncbi:hypothetical protein P152DRAFT_471232 [Eremomyces bilateralis CBS 781.70]|uniref:SWIM-type domain-containing protein n=1 Tax=Eremomyces bilateralis CBS 781.70 TaxID=1392243 RepID=A0A6G1GCM9_9PEZI|nr:uncharacterized protein P152DRAFT_471232 [Eremomyces bilateralis CBS 781.70]KAF1815848.1 hypothetical protein P152DRAFT_471232 [Eremomyces bilateralis CBS 781.70]
MNSPISPTADFQNLNLEQEEEEDMEGVFHHTRSSLSFVREEDNLRGDGYRFTYKFPAMKDRMDARMEAVVEHKKELYLTQQPNDEDLSLYSYEFSGRTTIKAYDDRRLTCSCTDPERAPGGPQEGDIACQHIFWFVDQLAIAWCRKKGIKAPTIEINPRCTRIKITRGARARTVEISPYEMIRDEIGIEDLPKSIQECTGFTMRRAQANDRLSVFDLFGTLGDKYLRSMESQTRLTTSRFFDRMIEQAARDPPFFHDLLEMFPVADCAAVAFELAHARVAQAFDALERYITYGPRGPIPVHSVRTCAEDLDQIVEFIGRWLEKLADAHQDMFMDDESDSDDSERIQHSEPTAAAYRGIGTLLEILDKVMAWARPAYERLGWYRAGAAIDAPTVSNLYETLVRHGGRDEEELFVLQALDIVPDELLAPFHRQLRALQERASRLLAPEPFVQKLGVMARRAEEQ